MKISNINTKDLHEFLKVSKGDSITIIANETLITLYYFDIEANRIVEKIINGNIEENGTVSIVNNVIKLLPKNEGITVTDDTIQYKNRKINFIDGKIKVVEDNKIYKLASTMTRETFDFMTEPLFATSKEEVRPIIQGLCFNNNEVVGLDGYRMSLRKSNNYKMELDETTKELVIHKDTINIIKSIKEKNDIKVYYYTDTDKYVKFTIGDYTIITKCIEGTYLKYQSLIQEPDNHNLIVKFKDIENLYNIANENKKNEYTKFEFDLIKDNVNIINTNEQYTLTDTLEIEKKINCKTYEKEIIAFNPLYIQEALKTFDLKEDIIMCIMTNVSPSLFINTTEQGIRTEFVLPMRLL